MNAQDKQIIPLTYGLADGVFHHEKNDRVFLIRRFPLKTISLHPLWKPVIGLLSGSPYVAIEEILSLFETGLATRVEKLLEDLVRKGFLARRGTAELQNS